MAKPLLRCDKFDTHTSSFRISYDLQELSLMKSLKAFKENCWRLLLKHREIFPVTDKGKLSRLMNLLE